jgi:hypothetical protein
MRPEFVSQMNQVRQKIMNKVKPKALNGRQVTGEMLAELAIAYTNAINSGNLPNIQSAWSYVCTNECQRAIYDSINVYYSRM